VRRSVLGRLLAAFLVVATAEIAATAYLVSRSTTSQLEDARSRSLDVDTAVHDALLAYAATHADWGAVGPVVDELAASSGRRIDLSAVDGTHLAVSGGGGAAASGAVDGVTAVVDVFATILADVDARAPVVRPAGSAVAETLPTSLPDVMVDPADPAGAEFLARSATLVTCGMQLTSVGVEERAVWGVPAAGVPDGCALLAEPSSNRYIELNNELVARTASCLAAQGFDTWTVMDASGIHRIGFTSDPVGLGDGYRTCQTETAREVLDPLVAAPAVVQLATVTATQPGWLEQAGGRRILVALVAVLVVALLASLLLGRRLLRPIRAMTDAARRMSGGERGARVEVRGHDEIARLGASFNELARAIEDGEHQRHQLVSDVAHELRTPLANVRGYLEAAQDDIVEVDDAWVGSLLEETMLLQHLVDDLQDLALADAGRLRLHVEPTDAVDIARQVVAAQRAHADAQGVSLGLDAPAAAPLLGDPVRLRQVLGNLVSNALRHTRRGAVTVRVRTTDAAVELEVADTGEGIAAEHLPHLFDRFFRADRSRTRATGGSGLGLAITKHFVDAHGGTITVRSAVGRGTVVTVALPTTSAAPVRRGATVPHGAPGTSVPWGHRRSSDARPRAAHDERTLPTIGP
jgi:two-component system sensor histidine kinase BaeS